MVKSRNHYNITNEHVIPLSGQRRPSHKRVVNKKHVTNIDTRNTSCTKAARVAHGCPTTVTGAGVTKCVVHTDKSITLHNRFHILGMLSDIDKACDNVEQQGGLVENSDIDTHDSQCNSKELDKLSGKHLGDSIPCLEGKSKIYLLGKKTKLGF